MPRGQEEIEVTFSPVSAFKDAGGAIMKGELPEFFTKVMERYPQVWKKYDELGRTISSLPGLDARTQRLVKLGIAIGAGSEGAVHSHARRAREEGISAEEIYHTALLAVTTIGWPGAVATLSWIEDILKETSP